jgi:hypothetical protein
LILVGIGVAVTAVSYVLKMTFILQWLAWILGGYAPMCGLVPMAAVLFSLAAQKGARPRLRATLTAVMLGVIAFMAVGNPLIGFPWEGYVG